MTELELIEQYKELHKQKEYGITSVRYLNLLILDIKILKPKRILDYGCGQSKLVDYLKVEFPNIEYFRYDPAIEKYSEVDIIGTPMVICTDVLEHIPVDFLQGFIKKITIISKDVFLAICCVPSVNHLPNGLNCHSTVRSPDWWEEILRKHFNIVERLFATEGERFVLFRTYNI